MAESEPELRIAYTPDLDHLVFLRWQRERHGIYMLTGFGLVVGLLLLIPKPSATWPVAVPLLVGGVLAVPATRPILRLMVRSYLKKHPEAATIRSVIGFSAEGLSVDHNMAAGSIQSESHSVLAWNHFKRARFRKDWMALEPKVGDPLGFVIVRKWFLSDEDWDSAIKIVRAHLTK